MKIVPPVVNKHLVSKRVSYTEFKWSICDFKRRVKNIDQFSKKVIKSEKFSLSDLNELCSLELALLDYMAELSLIVEDPKINLSTNKCIKICFLSNGVEKLCKFDTLTNNQRIAAFQIPSIDELLLEKNGYIENDVLTFLCKIYNVKEICQDYYNICNLKSSTFSKSIQQFYNNKELFDVTFIIGDTKIKAHSLMLAATSPYFYAMFSSENIEQLTREIDLSKDPDATADVCRGFLDYIYGCKNVKDMENIAHELIVLADKYDVNCLKESCEYFLSNKITENNVIDILLFAEKYSYNILNYTALNFARHHIREILSSSDFDEIYTSKNILKRLIALDKIEPQKTHCVSKLVLYHTQCEWSIEDFKERIKFLGENYFCQSKKISLNGSGKMCYFRLVIRDGVLRLEICYNSDIEHIRNVFAHLSIKSNNNMILQESIMECANTESAPKDLMYGNDIVTVSYIISPVPNLLKDSNSYLKYNTLTFVIHIFDTQNSESTEIPKNEILNSTVSKKLHQFYEQKQFCDVEFTIRDIKMYAHSLVLATMSPRFSQMFKTEKRNNKWEINLSNDMNVTPEILQGFLDFIYDQKAIEDLKHIAIDLVKFGFAYDIKILQIVFETVACKSIDRKNVVEYLLFANKYKCSILRDKTLEIVKACMRETKDTSEFDALLECKDIVVDLLT